MASANPSSLPSSPVGPLFFLLCLVHVVLKFALGAHVLGLKPTGDENAYVDAAMALSNLIRDCAHLLAPDWTQLRDNVVGNGWFMPGMPLLLTPLYLVAPKAGVVALRIYLGCISLGLWAWALAAVERRLGRPYAWALLVFPSLVPLWVMFSFTAWGDLYAGLLLVVLLCHAATTWQRLQRGQSISVTAGLQIGALAAACLYLRSSVLPLVPILFAALLLAAVVFTGGTQRRRALAACCAGIATFLVLLSPWSIAASKLLHARVVTTTTVPLSMAVAFGDQHDLCFGPCARGNIWFNAVGYSRAVAAEAGSDEVTVQKDMARYATRNATPQTYAADVFSDFGRYAFNPASFTHVFLPHGKAQHRSRTIVDRATRIPYYALMLALVAAWFTVVRRAPERQVASVLVKMFSACLLLQPFVHVGGGRYWTIFAPLFALSLGLLAATFADRRAAFTDGIAEDSAGRNARWMIGIQYAFIGGLVALSAALWWLGTIRA